MLVAVGLTLGTFLVWYVWERSKRKTHAMPGGLRPEITLPHTTEFELYHNSLSLCSKKVRVCSRRRSPRAAHRPPVRSPRSGRAAAI